MIVINGVEIQNIPAIDEEHVNAYANKLRSQSPRTLKNFVYFAPWLYAQLGKPIVSITIDDVKRVASAIIAKRNTKDSQLTLLKDFKAYYHFILKQIAATGDIRNNIFQYVDLPEFHKEKTATAEGHDVNMKGLDANIKAMNPELMDRIMKAAKVRSLREYTFFLIEKHMAFRGSENTTIRLNNIDFEQRIIVSGTVKGYAKEGQVISPFPKFLIVPLKKYIATLPEGTVWLFQTVNGSFLKEPENMVAEFRKKAGIEGWTAHQFRHSLVLGRKKMGCPDNDNEFLQNHQVVGAQAKFYRERNFDIAFRVKLYDQYHPYKSE